MKSEGFGVNQNAQERLYKNKKLLLENGERVLSGERMFGHTVMSDLMEIREKLGRNAVDSAEDRTDFIIEHIPGAEVRNLIDRSKALYRAGDEVNAAMWLGEARKSLSKYVDMGVLDSTAAAMFGTEIDEFANAPQ
jgi:hypothetical protein